MTMEPVAPPGTGRRVLWSREPPAGLAASLGPVANALEADAQRRAEALLAAAEQDAGAELARARAEAARILAQARSDGARAAERRTVTELASAHREAQGAVLAARRQAYLAARSHALERLAQRASTPEGRRLGQHLETLARGRVGPSAAVQRSGPGGLDVTAVSGTRRASIGMSELVDGVLRSMADEVATLWT